MSCNVCDRARVSHECCIPISKAEMWSYALSHVTTEAMTDSLERACNIDSAYLFYFMQRATQHKPSKKCF